jgi:ACT domain-containing protein
VEQGSFYKAVKEYSLSIVAFYDYNDLAKPDISLFKEMTTAVSQLKSEGNPLPFKKLFRLERVFRVLQ